MYALNISWLKSDGPYGIFESARLYTTAEGTIGTRQIFKKRMEFSPPPHTTTMGGTLPPMLSFFTTPAFFWRPVGVMDVKIRCPNAKCPEAHTAATSSSQRGILPFTNVTYTPPIRPSPLPSPRVIRRAHLMLEMEKMPVYRASILSVTGEILCIDGTKQVCLKVHNFKVTF